MNLLKNIEELKIKLEDDPNNEKLKLELSSISDIQKKMGFAVPEIKSEKVDNSAASSLQLQRSKLAAKIQKFGLTELQAELDELDRQIANDKKCQDHFRQFPEKVKTYHTAYGEVTWFVDEKIIECQGAKFTDEEILKMSANGMHLTDFEFELKRQFPHVTLIGISEREAA